MLDVSNTNEEQADPALVPIYRADFAKAAELASVPAWLVLHRPIRSVVAVTEADGARQVVGGDATLIAALAEAGLPPVELLLSGHMHTFQVLNFEAPLPPQVIVGNSGTLLNITAPGDLAGLVVGGETVRSGVGLNRFGFMLLTRTDAGWQAELYSPAGSVLQSCRVGDREVACRAPN